MRRWIRTVWLQWRLLLRRGTFECEPGDDRRVLLDHAIAENLARGLAPEEGRRQNLLEIGGIERLKEEGRYARGWRLVADIGRDIGYSARMLRKSPGFAAIGIVTLALGIGATISMLGVVDALLFRVPAHIHAPGQIFVVGRVGVRKLRPEVRWPYSAYERLCENVPGVDWTAEAPTSPATFGQGDGARPVAVGYVTHTYMRVLGAHALLGRWFDAKEDQPVGSPPVVLLGYDFWRRAFGGDPRVLGRRVKIGGQERTVVGVAPRGFTGAGFVSVAAWLPIHASPVPRSGFLEVTVLGRPHTGVAAAQVATETTRTLSREMQGPAARVIGAAVRLMPLFASRWKTLSSDDRVTLWIAGVVLLLLSIACLNVSSLLVARIARRRHEMAIRQHLGATRERLIQQVLIEGLLLGASGGAAALLVALAVQPLIRAFLLPQGFYEGSFLNGRLLLTAAALAAFAGSASGLVPAWRASGPRLAETLKQGERGHTHEGARLRWVLVVTQIGLAFLLTVGAGLFIRSLGKINALQLGFRPDHVLRASVYLDPEQFSVAEATAAYERMQTQADRVPGVVDAALASTEPLGNSSFQYSLTEATSDSGKLLYAWTAFPYTVTPSFFSTIGLRILQGRPLLDSDTEGSASVVVVNQSLARDLWPGRSPLRRCMKVYPRVACTRVVGVAADSVPESSSPFGWAGMTRNEFYVPLQQASLPGRAFWSAAPGVLLLRLTGQPSAAAGRVFAALESVSPGGRYVSIEPYTEIFDSRTRAWRMGASMFSFFSGLGLLLAAVGIYGVLSSVVRQRTAEIGVRMALGATPQDVLRMVIGEGMKFAVLGIALGTGAALGLTRLMRGLLYGVTATDPRAFVAAAVVLALVALGACGTAARSAMRVNPVVALRLE